MSKEIEINLSATPPSKKEIDDKSKDILLNFKVTVFSTAICFIITITCFVLNKLPSSVISCFFLLTMLCLIFSFIGGYLASSFEPDSINKNDEDFIKSMSPNSDIVKYLGAVKEQDRVLIRLEVDAIKEFIKNERPKVQLNEIVSNFNNEKGE